MHLVPSIGPPTGPSIVPSPAPSANPSSRPSAIGATDELRSVRVERRRVPLRELLLRPIAPSVLRLALGILALNLLDAFATLRHLTHGAEELNPLMRALIHRGATEFLVAKHLLASLGVIGITLHGRVRAARIALWILFPLYLLIGVYQLALLAIIR